MGTQLQDMPRRQAKKPGNCIPGNRRDNASVTYRDGVTSIKQNRAARVHMGGRALCALNHTLGAFDLHPRGGFDRWAFRMETPQAVQYRFRSP